MKGRAPSLVCSSAAGAGYSGVIEGPRGGGGGGALLHRTTSRDEGCVQGCV